MILSCTLGVHEEVCIKLIRTLTSRMPILLEQHIYNEENNLILSG